MAPRRSRPAPSEPLPTVGDVARAIRVHPEGAVLATRVAPRSGVTALDRIDGDTPRIRIAAPPVDGAANTALVRFLATTLDCSRSTIRIVTGEHGRQKHVLIAGMTPREVSQRIAPRLPTG